MFGEKHDPEFLKHLFESTEILRKPVTEPEAEQSDDVPDADRPGFLARLLGR